MSTITKHLEAGGGSSFACALGMELRRLRTDAGLTQRAVGNPMSRSFICLVEQGRVTPSLPSLLIIARRLNTSAAAILAAVEVAMEDDS